ncbi:MAG: TFIIB-type zinc ribbon-containing protein, partial [Nitrosarchaeum sp.]
MSQSADSNNRCPRCAQGKLVTDNESGEMFCSKCGFVAIDKVEQEGPEWRSFSKEGDNRTRTGTPISLAIHDMGLATIINPINKDATGKPLSASMKSTIERLRTWDN